MDLINKYQQQVFKLQDVYNNIKFKNIFGKLVLSREMYHGQVSLYKPQPANWIRLQTRYPPQPQNMWVIQKGQSWWISLYFNCPHFENPRKKVIKKRHRHSPSSVKFETLTNVANMNQLYKLWKFIKRYIYISWSECKYLKILYTLYYYDTIITHL